MPAPGGSRRARPARPAPGRAARARRRSARAAPRGRTWAFRRRRRPGSAGGGSGSRPRPAAAPSGRTSSLRTSVASRGVTWLSPGLRAWTPPRWKTSPSTAPRSSTRRSAGSSWSSRAASSARSVGGTARAPSACSAMTRISEMNSGLPPEAGRSVGAAPAHARSDQFVDLVVRKRLEPQRHRPRRAALGKLRPRHAEKEDRRAGGEQPHVLDEVEEGLLPPLDVVENDRRAAALLLEQLAEGPGDLLRDAPAAGSPSSARSPSRQSRRKASASSCFTPRPPASR